MSTTSTKSPAAPSRSLEACSEVAQKIYDSYTHASFGVADIASKADMTATSGSFKSLLSDLKQYGLIEKVGPDAYQITQAFKEFAAASPEGRGQIQYMLAINPPFFEKLLDSFHGTLPEVNSLKNILISQHHFNKEKAGKTSKALFESLNWAGALDGKRNIIPPKDNTPIESAQAVPQEEEDPNASSSTNNLYQIPQSQPQHPSESDSKLLTIQLPLAGSRAVQVVYPADLAKEEASRVGTVLTALAIGDE